MEEKGKFEITIEERVVDLWPQMSEDVWEDVDIDRVREAAEAALGIGGKDWWGVELAGVGVARGEGGDEEL